jgi:hypothetical protein
MVTRAEAKLIYAETRRQGATGISARCCPACKRDYEAARRGGDGETSILDECVEIIAAVLHGTDIREQRPHLVTSTTRRNR